MSPKSPIWIRVALRGKLRGDEAAMGRVGRRLCWICVVHCMFVWLAAFGFAPCRSRGEIGRNAWMQSRALRWRSNAPQPLRAKPSLEHLLGEAGHSVLLQHLGAEDEKTAGEEQAAKQQKRQAKREKLKAKKAVREALTSKPTTDSVEDEEMAGEGSAEDAGEANSDDNGDGTGSKADADKTSLDRVHETKEQRLRRERPARVRFATTSPQPNFVSLKLEHVAVAFGDQEVLQDATWEVKTGERVGLVGGNGSGKTSMMRILEGTLEPTAGDVIKSTKDLRIAVLRQEFVDELTMDRTLKQELLSVLEKEIASVQKGNSTNAKVERVMATMGFSTEDAARQVGAFSGGWKMRIALAKVLLQNPNILMLDEPTNHLDLESVEWLEGFLVEQKIPMVVISHDREFLNRISNKIVEVAGGRTFTYNGDYNSFVKQREDKFHAWTKQYEQQQRRMEEDTKYIKQNRNKKEKLAAVRQKEKALESLLNGKDLIPPPPKELRFRFRFPPSPRCRDSVLRLTNVGHGYGELGADAKLFSGVTLDISKGERIGIVGPNGCGKSTLLRVAAGLEKPRTGAVVRPSNNVAVGYFAQSQADALDMDRTVVQALQEMASDEHEYVELRNLLGQFRFGSDFVDKPVRLLSGGEKARLAICRLLLAPANLLVLDEPTNHLDVVAREILEDALRYYDGAVLLVSHDRYFMSQVATKIYSFEDGELVEYGGDYLHFLAHKPTLQDRTQARYVHGSSGILPARPPRLEQLEDDKRKTFGGHGASGRKDQGVKNANRYN